MKTTQQGFTLIELMIVVAIIGILAAVAIPAYQDYTIRARVAEGIGLASGVKTGVSEYYASEGTLPADNDEAGVTGASSINGNNVRSITVGAAGDITVAYSGGGVNLNNKTLVLTPDTSSGNLQWNCTLGDLGNQYRPSNCRN